MAEAKGESGRIGVIGGSGLYEMPDLLDVEETTLDTPFGSPSDSYVLGRLGGRPMAFLARHGRGHVLMPTEVNFRANIYGMKLLGVERILSVSAVGSLKEDIHPSDIVFPDQFIDRTTKRASTFFGGGIVGHVQLGDPVCPILLEILTISAMHHKIRHHRGGTYICMEGPAFSTRAESQLYRSWGGTVIGMTNLQEARLAREAEMCFATIALATDYDCWHESEEEVNVENVLKVMRENVATSKLLLIEAVGRIGAERPCGCGESLRGAIVTPMESIPEQIKTDLAPIIGRYLEP